MRNGHSINNLQISSDTLSCLRAEFDESINSKRLSSQITSIEQLIRVLWNRNLFNSDENTKNHIFKYIQCTEHRAIIQDYINSLNTIDNHNASQNVYAQIRKGQKDKKCSSASTSNATRQSTAASNGLTILNKKSDESPLPGQYHRICQIVCDYIEDWRDLGRCLDITDGDLNRIGLDQCLQHNIKLMTNRVLEQAQEKFRDGFVESLCTALKEARRKDILRKLKELNLINY